jgi:hypothetical protein
MAFLDDMPVPLLSPPALTSRSRRAPSAVLAVVSLVTVVAGCALARTVDTEPGNGASSASAAANASAANRVVLRFNGQVVTGVLDDTPVAREFAALLPLTLQLSDPMGQAKSGPLPLARSLNVTDADRTFQTTVGELAYWSPSTTVAVVYDDLGQRVPEPGLVRLGEIDTGLPDLAAAGHDVVVRIELAANTGS